jgi:hypothetical protein
MRWTPGALLLAAACNRPAAIAPDVVALTVTTPAQEANFGDAIPLTIVRSWRKDLTAQEWPAQAFAPLRLRLVDAVRRENATHVEDTRRYDAYVFGTDPLTVAVPAFVARGAGEEVHKVDGPHLTLRMRSSLAAADDLTAELPRDLFPAPARTPSACWWLVPLGLLAVLAWWWRRATHPRATRVDGAVTQRPDARALTRLAKLRGPAPTDPAAVAAFFTELAATLRDYVGERFGVRSAERTTDEILAADVLQALPAHGLAARALTVCDLVKFARAHPTPAECERAVDAVSEFVRGTAEVAS